MRGHELICLQLVCVGLSDESGVSLRLSPYAIESGHPHPSHRVIAETELEN